MRILVVEDEKKMASLIKNSLTGAGYTVDLAETGKAAEALARSGLYQLILLDVGLPDQNGFETAPHLRADGFKGPILMLTALSGTKDKVRGLDAGADDYLTKPFSLEELLARVRALLRRGKSGEETTLSFADLEMNLLTRTVRRGPREIHLTQREFSLLEFFLRHAGQTVTRTSIAESVWNVHHDSGSNVIDVHVNTLRKKLETSHEPRLLHTVVGMGYVLRTP